MEKVRRKMIFSAPTTPTSCASYAFEPPEDCLLGKIEVKFTRLQFLTGNLGRKAREVLTARTWLQRELLKLELAVWATHSHTHTHAHICTHPYEGSQGVFTQSNRICVDIWGSGWGSGFRKECG